MDPNAALDELRELARQLRDPQPEQVLDDLEDVGRMVELFEGLDTWLLKGGFLPDAWGRSDGARA
jgi:hypothetical protein